MTDDSARRVGLAGRRLYLCTPDRSDLAAFLQECISGGVDVVQLREKELGDVELMARGRLAMNVCGSHQVPFILNDRPDLAADLGADGVHVGQEDVAATEARRLVGMDAIVGLSTHNSDQLTTALSEPVDYISVGPVVPTPTKPGRPGTGLAYVTEAGRRCRSAAPPMPFFVTGDARPDTVRAMVEAGGRRFVAVRWLTVAPDPRRAARQLADAIDRAVDEADGGESPA